MSELKPNADGPILDRLSEWSIVYERAIRDDGSLLFPEKLTELFLDDQRRSMGSMLFANQYLNRIVSEDDKKFRDNWLKYYEQLPPNTHTFAMIDPAIGKNKTNDYTGIVVVKVDSDGHWFVPVARRDRLTPTEIVNKIFELHAIYNLQGIGVESVAYQEALIHFTVEEMKKRKKTVPLFEVKRNATSKETRILSLVPRFEWGMISLAHGLTDLEDEYSSFPRAAHDDILDALASIEEFVFYPQKIIQTIKKPASASHPDYERWYIQQLSKGSIEHGRE